MKKIVLITVFFIFLLSFVSSAITDYRVPGNLPLNKTLTIYGVYSGGADVVCSFFIFDIVDQNQVIIRLSDEYTNSLGQFYSEYQVTEPLFRRGIDYNAVSVCGSDEIGSVFYVEQKEDVAFGISPGMLRNDFAWWLDRDNSLTIVTFFILVLVMAAIAYRFYVDAFK